MPIEDLHSILADILSKVNNIEQVVDKLNIKLSKVEEKVNNIQNIQNPQIAMVTSISTTEEKINLLNKQTNVDREDNLLEAINKKDIITQSGVLNILNGKITIYQYIADVIHEFDNNSSNNYIYGFSDSKNCLFFWNHSKKTWAKMGKNYLYDLFMTLQKKIIIKYNQLLNQDDNLKKECVENGDLIFADNFEKKYGEFKKIIISKFI